MSRLFTRAGASWHEAVGQLRASGPKSLLRNTGYSSAGQLVSVVASTLGAIVTARLLGPSGRGEYAAAVSAAAIVATVSLLGCGMAAPSFLARGVLGGRDALRLGVALCSLGAMAMFVIHQAAGARLQLPGGTGGAVILSFGVAALVMGSMQVSAASGLGRLRSAAANQVATAAMTAVSLLVVLPVVPPGWRLLVALALWMLGQWVGDAVGWAMLLRSGPTEARRQRPSMRGFARFAAAAYPGTIIGQLGFRLDIVLLPILATSAATGVYSLAVVAGTLVGMLPGSFAMALVSALGGMSGVEARRTVRHGVLACLAIAAVTGLLLLAALSLLAVPLLGEGYESLAGVFAILLPGVIAFAPVHVLVAYANTTLVKPHIPSLVAALWTGIDIVLLVLLAPSLGAGGAALASSISYVCGAVAMLLFTARAAGLGRLVRPHL